MPKMKYIVPHPYLFGLALHFLLCSVFTIRVRVGQTVQNFLVVISLLCLNLWICMGISASKFSLLWIPLDQVKLEGGQTFPPDANPFMPFGISSILTGSRMCFFGYFGMDAVTFAGEEAMSPSVRVPGSIIISWLMTFFIFGVTMFLYITAWPWYNQAPEDAFIYKLHTLELKHFKWIVIIGATCANISSAYGWFYALTRSFYTMSKYGLAPKWFAEINRSMKIPMRTIALFLLISGVTTAIISTSQLIEVFTVCVLVIYLVTILSFLTYWYQYPSQSPEPEPSSGSDTSERRFSWNAFAILVLRMIYNCPYPSTEPSKGTQRMAYILIAIIFVSTCILDSLAVFTHTFYGRRRIVCFLLFFIVTLTLSLWRQPFVKPRNVRRLVFYPLLPVLAIIIIVYLLMKEPLSAFAGYFSWQALGVVVYISSKCVHFCMKKWRRHTNHEIGI